MIEEGKKNNSIILEINDVDIENNKSYLNLEEVGLDVNILKNRKK